MKFMHAYKKTCSIIIILFIISLGAGCKKMIQIPAPEDQIIEPEVFSDDATATSAIDGIYSQAMSTNLLFLNGALSIFPGLSADEIYNTSPSSQLDPFTNDAIPVNETTTLWNRLWKWGYTTIYQANACLEGLHNSTGLSITTRNQLTGETLFMRALCYFYLTNLFGNVPLITTTNYKINEHMQRTPSDSVYKQIISDLLDAQNLLNPDYPSDGPIRPNKWAAAALLARVYLYQGNWSMAESETSEVINSGEYNLVSDVNQVFLANSPEAILQFIPVNQGFNTAEGFAFIPFSVSYKPTYAITSYLLNSFEPGDMRKTDWLKSQIVNGQTYYFPYKYKVRFSFSVTEYNMVLRLAEQYLIRAEARAEQNDLSGALADLDVIRNRAGLPDDTANDKTSILSAIMHERQVELFCEWGNRWFDLKRTGEINDVLSKEKANWTPTAALYPIPLTEIKRNPFLTQNPGY